MRGLISYLSAWGSDHRLCLEILPSRENEILIFMKNGDESRNVLGASRKRYRYP